MSDQDGRFTDEHRRRLAAWFTLGAARAATSAGSADPVAAWSTAGMAVMAYLLGCEVGTVSATEQRVEVAIGGLRGRTHRRDHRRDREGWRPATDTEQREDRTRQAEVVKALIVAAGDAVAEVRGGSQEPPPGLPGGPPGIAAVRRGAHVRRRLEVKRNWSAVAALADLLDRGGVVDGARAMGLLRSAIPRRSAA